MEFNLMLKTDKKAKDNSKSSFSSLVFLFSCTVIIIIAILALRRYDFYINISNEKEKIEVNAIYSNQIQK
ncbi:MAG: hypothetical protein J6J60_04565 [Clostridia bacterium]|nr:hypothetical protein [Clostridia bacterium]